MYTMDVVSWMKTAAPMLDAFMLFNQWNGIQYGLLKQKDSAAMFCRIQCCAANSANMKPSTSYCVSLLT